VLAQRAAQAQAEHQAAMTRQRRRRALEALLLVS